MEQELLQFIGVFAGGVVVGIIIMLILNKISSGSASPSAIKQEYQQYQGEVERHFEETSKKFKNMTEQYQDLYKHLSVGATSLCRSDSAAAALADQRSPMDEPSKLEDAGSQEESAPEQDEQAKIDKAKLEKARLEAKLENARVEREKKASADSEPAKADMENGPEQQKQAEASAAAHTAESKSVKGREKA